MLADFISCLRSIPYLTNESRQNTLLEHAWIKLQSTAGYCTNSDHLLLMWSAYKKLKCRVFLGDASYLCLDLIFLIGWSCQPSVLAGEFWWLGATG